MTRVPATLPLGEIVRRLNETQPPALLAHSTTLVLLAGEQRAGRLRISPHRLSGIGELLTADRRLFDRLGLRPMEPDRCAGEPHGADDDARAGDRPRDREPFAESRSAARAS